MEEKCYLSWTVYEEVVVAETGYVVQEPVYVLLQELHTVDEGAIGAQLQVLHHIVYSHQLRYVGGDLVRQQVVGRVCNGNK